MAKVKNRLERADGNHRERNRERVALSKTHIMKTRVARDTYTACCDVQVACSHEVEGKW